NEPKVDIKTKAELGDFLFNDKTLSNPGGQSCASCHFEDHAFIDPRRDSPTSQGAIKTRFGNRQAPTLMYVKYIPKLHWNVDEDGEEGYKGGLFWDGRASTMLDQAKGPFLNPMEMNNTTPAQVVAKVQKSAAAPAMKALYGKDIFNNVDKAYNAIADAIVKYESTAEFTPFNSKFDRYLDGKEKLTLSEKRGLDLFNGKAKCFNCHSAAKGPKGEHPVFSDFCYYNTGVPKNWLNRFLLQPKQFNPDGLFYKDTGLASTTHRNEDLGKFRVQTLRNIAVTAPYFHNGRFNTLYQVVQFYNKRDTGLFGPSEFPA
ncbi:MAG: cytochrome c peroxidase, partial [Armatimonadota bacterium]